MPPRAIIIDNPPPALPQILSFFSTPKTEQEAVEWIHQNTCFSVIQAKTLIQELIDSGIIGTTQIDLTDRYSRQQLYFDFIETANPEKIQQTLTQKKVAVIGVGGIGSHVATHLVTAGIGSLVLIDDDHIEESNLAKQSLYDEDTVGNQKVNIANQKLNKLNSSTQIISIPKKLTEQNHADFFSKYLYDCDFIVLSADSPPLIHTWINHAAFKHGFAYSNAGYIESMGIVGPMIIPYETACYQCYKHIGDTYQYTNQPEKVVNINRGYQSPSYGPLNALVSSIQANEIIRYFLNLAIKTKGCRLLIDSNNYQIEEELFEKRAACQVCN